MHIHKRFSRDNTGMQTPNNREEDQQFKEYLLRLDGGHVNYFIVLKERNRLILQASKGYEQFMYELELPIFYEENSIIQ